MKHLFASLLTVVCFATYAQFPSIPYNPDENGDGLIGVVDLQGLLANYGNEFASAVVSEDGESAIVYMGEMGYPLCALSCKNLPGIWSLTTLDDLGLVWDELTNEFSQTFTWIEQTNTYSTPNTAVLEYLSSGNNVSEGAFVGHTGSPGRLYRCYCAANQLPRVEYELIAVAGYDAFVEGCQALTEAGWFPIQGSPSSGYGNYSQAFWRWAE